MAVAGSIREESVTGVDDTTIRALAAASSGSGPEIPGAPPDRKVPGEEPVHLPLLFVALCLLPLDVAVRRIGK